MTLFTFCAFYPETYISETTNVNCKIFVLKLNWSNELSMLQSLWNFDGRLPSYLYWKSNIHCWFKAELQRFYALWLRTSFWLLLTRIFHSTIIQLTSILVLKMLIGAKIVYLFKFPPFVCLSSNCIIIWIYDW